jgi:hypothetical protein
MTISYLLVIIGSCLVVFSKPCSTVIGRVTSLENSPHSKGILHFIRFMVLSLGALLAVTALQQVLKD